MSRPERDTNRIPLPRMAVAVSSANDTSRAWPGRRSALGARAGTRKRLRPASAMSGGVQVGVARCDHLLQAHVPLRPVVLRFGCVPAVRGWGRVCHVTTPTRRGLTMALSRTLQPLSITGDRSTIGAHGDCADVLLGQPYLVGRCPPCRADLWCPDGQHRGHPRRCRRAWRNRKCAV